MRIITNDCAPPPLYSLIMLLFQLTSSWSSSSDFKICAAKLVQLIRLTWLLPLSELWFTVCEGTRYKVTVTSGYCNTVTATCAERPGWVRPYVPLLLSAASIPLCCCQPAEAMLACWGHVPLSGLQQDLFLPLDLRFLPPKSQIW